MCELLVINVESRSVGRCKILGRPGQETKCVPSFLPLQICAKRLTPCKFARRKWTSKTIKHTNADGKRIFFLFLNWVVQGIQHPYFTHAFQIIGATKPAPAARFQRTWWNRPLHWFVVDVFFSHWIEIWQAWRRNFCFGRLWIVFIIINEKIENQSMMFCIGKIEIQM